MNIREFFTSKWVILSFIAFIFLFAWFLSAPLSAILIGLAGNVFLGYILSGPRYKGRASDHFNDKKFINPGGVEAKGLGGLLKWILSRKRGEWKKLKNVTYGEKPKARVEKGIRITFVNHSTFLIQADGLNILTDPVWSERASPFSWAGPKRMRPPGIRFDDLPQIDVVLLSHNHYDHLDLPTMKKVYKKFQPKIFTALGVKAFLEQNEIKNSTDMDWWDELVLSENLKLLAVPSQHFSGRGMFDRDATLWCGFVIKRRDGNIYFGCESTKKYCNSF